MGLKKCIYFTYPPLAPHTYDFTVLNFFNPSKKNSFGCAANRKIGKAKDLSALIRRDPSILDLSTSWRQV
jgi:hypothetical protein